MKIQSFADCLATLSSKSNGMVMKVLGKRSALTIQSWVWMKDFHDAVSAVAKVQPYVRRLLDRKCMFEGKAQASGSKPTTLTARTRSATCSRVNRVERRSRADPVNLERAT